MNPAKPTLLFGLCVGLLSACAMPEKPQAPLSAADLARSELVPGNHQAGSLAQSDAAIVDMPQVEPLQAQQGVNQAGNLPALRNAQVSAPAVPKVAPQDDEIRLNYEQVPLRQILEEFADLLGISLVIDSSIADKVTLRTAEDKPLRMADLWPVIQLLLDDADIVMERKGNVYHLKKTPDALPVEIGDMRSGLTSSSAPEVMQVTPLRYISIDAASAALKPMVEPQGRLVTLPTLNLLGITTSPQRLRRVNSLLSLLDADPFRHRGLRLYRLSNAKASELQADLDKILKAVEGTNPSYQVVGLERINAILVVSPPGRGFDQVSRWVDILDEANDAGGEQVFIYRVRHLKASTLAGTLSEVFQTEKEDEPRKRDDEAKGDKPAANPNNDNAPDTKRTEIKRTGETDKTAGGGDSGRRISAELKVNIVSDDDTNSLLVRATPRDYRQLLETIRILDTVPKEVMVNAVIAEVELTEASRFGIDWQRMLGGIDDIVMTNFGIANAFTSLTNAATSDTTAQTSLSGLAIKQNSNKLTAVLNAVATNNNVSLLSRPSLLVKDNQEASINVGSDEPTITRTNTSLTSGVATAVTSNEVQYRQTGITLNITPHINADGIINMDVEQEVSQPGPEKTSQNLPSFNQRKIKTSIVVRDGTAIVLGGLIQTSQKNSRTGVPLLHEVPLFGNFFADTNKQIIRTELVVIIVPQIIDPEADNRLYVERFQRRMDQLVKLFKQDQVPVWINTDPDVPLQPTRRPELPGPSLRKLRLGNDTVSISAETKE